jgi:hypothetical protein
MPINKSTKAGNGAAVAYHKVVKLEINLNDNTTLVTVKSYADEDAANNQLPAAWNWEVALDISGMVGSTNISNDIEAALIAPGATFEGGCLTTDNSTSVETLKERKRAEITAARLKADSDHFTYTYTVQVAVPATEEAEATTQDVELTKDIRTADKDMFDLLATDARMQKGWPSNWPGGWKAIDNTYLPIATKEEWDAFFIAAYDAGVNNFLHSQELKALLEAATTAEEIAAISW